MFKKIIQFIKYNLLIVVVGIVAFVAVASAVASNENIKKNVIGEEIVKKSGVDNSLLLVIDLENFDLEMEITNALEDEENFYIDYQYKMLAIKDNAWQEVLYKKQLIVSKASLDGRDLGLYAMEELGEIIDYQLAFLKEVQEKEIEKGVTVVLETTEYTGLIGLVFDTKTKELPGYEPVVKPPVIEEIDDRSPDESQGDDGSATEPKNDDPIDDSAYYQKLKELCEENNLFWYDNVCHDEPKILVCDSDHLDLCNTKDLCDGIGLYWYDDVCNAEEKESAEEPIEEPADEEPICDLENLSLCNTQDSCLGADLHWYDEVCNVEEEVVQEEVVVEEVVDNE
ncbi:MAG: hypothetical protein KAI71_03540 [Candidatus Pacebacteria bacterium]|nr:hypothetical protein [Candidatus Paceibacterota bacterium]